MGLSLCPYNFNYLRRRLRREKTAGDFRSFVVLNPNFPASVYKPKALWLGLVGSLVLADCLKKM